MAGGRDDLAPMLVLGEDAKFEEVRRIIGDRVGVTAPTPCREFNDVRLCNVGVIERSMLPIELELGALRRGDFVGRFNPEVAGVPCPFGLAILWVTGEEDGRAVAAAADSESRFMFPASTPPSLFVD